MLPAEKYSIGRDSPAAHGGYHPRGPAPVGPIAGYGTGPARGHLKTAKAVRVKGIVGVAVWGGPMQTVAI